MNGFTTTYHGGKQGYEEIAVSNVRNNDLGSDIVRWHNLPDPITFPLISRALSPAYFSFCGISKISSLVGRLVPNPGELRRSEALDPASEREGMRLPRL
jgi:hypothetical protein